MKPGGKTNQWMHKDRKETVQHYHNKAARNQFQLLIWQCISYESLRKSTQTYFMNVCGYWPGLETGLEVVGSIISTKREKEKKKRREHLGVNHTWKTNTEWDSKQSCNRHGNFIQRSGWPSQACDKHAVTQISVPMTYTSVSFFSQLRYSCVTNIQHRDHHAPNMQTFLPATLAKPPLEFSSSETLLLGITETWLEKGGFAHFIEVISYDEYKSR